MTPDTTSTASPHPDASRGPDADMAYSLAQKIDMSLHDAIGLAEIGTPLHALLSEAHSDVHDLAYAIKNPDASREPAGGGLPAPRLQLRWALSAEGDPGWGLPPRYLEKGEGGHRRWICHYEFVVPLREHDIRREREDAPEVTELVIPISKTQRGSTRPPDDEPFRDGAHAAWDAPHFGNPPIYVLPFAGPAVLLSDLHAQRQACRDADENARTSPSPGPAGAEGASAGEGAA